MKKITCKKEGILAQFLRAEYKGKKNAIRLADAGWEVESAVVL